MIIVKMLKNAGNNTSGQVCGLPDNVALDYIRRKVAVKHGDGIPAPRPAVTPKRVPADQATVGALKSALSKAQAALTPAPPQAPPDPPAPPQAPKGQK